MVIFLCGCKGKEAEPQLAGISFDASLRYGTYECEANIELGENGQSKAVLLAPESVKGAELLFSGEGISVNYMGISYTPQSKLPNETVNSVLSTILSYASKGAQKAAEREGLYVLENNVAGYSYKLYMTESGLPVKLECDDAELYAEFSNVKINK